MSSPRMWGCFYSIIFSDIINPVFPTHVGVFPRLKRGAWSMDSLPHACGGVSESSLKRGSLPPSSPRMWGCFQPS